MKLLYLGILKRNANPDPDNPAAHELVCEKDVSSFGRFIRGPAGQAMTTGAKVFAQFTKVGQRQSGKTVVASVNYTINTYCSAQGICAVAITDEEYPNRVALGLLTLLLDKFHTKFPESSLRAAKEDGHFDFPELKEHLIKYQDPENADMIIKVQNDLDETVALAKKNVEALALRGDQIKSLELKADGLSAEASKFAKKAKDQNSCCVIM